MRQAAVVISARQEDAACFIMEGVSTWIISLGASAISTRTSASRVVSSSDRNLLVFSVLLVSL